LSLTPGLSEVDPSQTKKKTDTIIGSGVHADWLLSIHLKNGKSGTMKNHLQRQSNLQKKKF